MLANWRRALPVGGRQRFPETLGGAASWQTSRCGLCLRDLCGPRGTWMPCSAPLLAQQAAATKHAPPHPAARAAGQAERCTLAAEPALESVVSKPGLRMAGLPERQTSFCWWILQLNYQGRQQSVLWLCPSSGDSFARWQAARHADWYALLCRGTSSHKMFHKSRILCQSFLVNFSLM